MVILGIDPGLANTGWGVVEVINQRYRPVSFGVITTKTDTALP
ncbi:MAG: crossover junction endodeoxyribonuclease RuvC, partial [Bullifex sp.]